MAGNALRRRSVKLMSLSAGYGDLNMLVSQLKNTRQTAKNFADAQAAVVGDLVKWASHEKNEAIRDVANHILTLNSLWTETQYTFSERLKDFRCQFDAVLDGEKQVNIAKSNVGACEKREASLRKDIKKLSKKGSNEDLRHLQNKLAQTERAKDLAKIDYSEKMKETESLKLIRFRQGLLRLSEAYEEMGNKCAVIFSTQKDICLQIPNVNSSDSETMSYAGYIATKDLVLCAQQQVMQYRSESNVSQSNSMHQELPVHVVSPPPPYNPGCASVQQPIHRTDTLPRCLQRSNSGRANISRRRVHSVHNNEHGRTMLPVGSDQGQDTVYCPNYYGTCNRGQELLCNYHGTCNLPGQNNCNTNIGRNDDDDGWGSDFDDEVCAAMGTSQIR